MIATVSRYFEMYAKCELRRRTQLATKQKYNICFNLHKRIISRWKQWNEERKHSLPIARSDCKSKTRRVLNRFGEWKPNFVSGCGATTSTCVESIHSLGPIQWDSDKSDAFHDD